MNSLRLKFRSLVQAIQIRTFPVRMWIRLKVQTVWQQLEGPVVKVSVWLWYRKNPDGSLTWGSRLCILATAFIIGVLFTKCLGGLIVDLLAWGPDLRDNNIFRSAVTLGLFGLFFGLGNWIIKNEDIQKQFKDTFIGRDELIFSNAAKALFEQGDNRRSLRIYGLLEIIRLSRNQSIDKERINLVTGFKHDLSGIRLEGSMPEEFCLGKTCLEKAQFIGIDAPRIDLRYSILSNATFYWCSLVGADLSNADCQKCDLCVVDLINVALVNTNFQEAVFDGVTISGILRGTDFRGATLKFVDLSQTFLIEAKFEGAKYAYTTFPPGFNLQEHGMVNIEKDMNIA